MNTLMPEILLDTRCRFWSYVDKRSENECWNWIGALNSAGYGCISINNVNYQIHRIAYYIHFNRDPDELLVCHKCNNKACVNPNHLFLGTYSDNNQHAFDTGIKNNKRILHPRTDFIESDILEIRKLCKIIMQKEIAIIFSVSRQIISDICSRKTWRHIQ